MRFIIVPFVLFTACARPPPPCTTWRDCADGEACVVDERRARCAPHVARPEVVERHMRLRALAMSPSAAQARSDRFVLRPFSPRRSP